MKNLIYATIFLTLNGLSHGQSLGLDELFKQDYRGEFSLLADGGLTSTGLIGGIETAYQFDRIFGITARISGSNQKQKSVWQLKTRSLSLGISYLQKLNKYLFFKPSISAVYSQQVISGHGPNDFLTNNREGHPELVSGNNLREGFELRAQLLYKVKRKWLIGLSINHETYPVGFHRNSISLTIGRIPISLSK